ncbi:putative glycoside hydrolase family 95 protein [Phaeoacremonium minimum UCRPA7]|uniref:Putative glycoside hydrolase family 95 protein n=1 Tax=Phaeoacremonium minimum (strain UCR-PA7) TaxID=1286976 RepID=R8BQT7_PHAM7|nr:putative glycoside hydrolase family 95 protein [Phaeoacremonium minimum UCRPA7]EOO01743.1 putative glycoside hydrolase family 95 protein [Phaeoacremonium minimum UCRPA7]
MTSIDAADGEPAVPPGAAHHQQHNNNKHLQLHYGAPASQWAAALPIGNGRLGAMVHGRTTTELLQLNEDSVWYGGPQDRSPRDALRNLPLLRQLIRQERHAEAEELIRTAFFATPASMRHYEPLGTCTIEFGHASEGVTGYSRSLDLSNAVCTARYRYTDEAAGDGGLDVCRQMIASFPDQVLALRVTSSRKTRSVIRLDRVSEIEWETNEYLDSIETIDGRIVLQATPGGRNSNQLAIVLGVTCDDVASGGSVEALGNCLIVNSASYTIAIAAQTTYRENDPVQKAIINVDGALSQPWEELLTRHITDYQGLFGRMGLRMWPDANDIPTDERIKDNRDPGLIALYSNYGRYLLISSSRDSPSPLPANLQGIWSPSFAPPWGSKYTININIQMNYWPVSASNLFECSLPLVDLLERIAERGKKTAKAMYACRGWCAHHNTDIWADTDPQDRWMPSTIWPLGGAWLCIDMMKLLKERYDPGLHERLAPVLEGCVEFLLDFLIPSQCGRYLVTNPSLSPENTFISEDGKPGILCEGSTMDTTIVGMVFKYFLWSIEKSGQTHALTEQVKCALGRLPPVQINKDGLIQEWGLKDYGEHEPGHRHVSHLFGLYPGDTLSTPEERQAAKKVLDRRAAHGGGHTGWSRAWLLNLHARLLDAEGCGRHMDQLLRSSTLPNMLDNHPPFQIDGNFGGCAGILECLVQWRDGDDGCLFICLLPACPKEWSRGELTNVCIKGNWLVSFTWEESRLVGQVVIRRLVDDDETATFEAHGTTLGSVRAKGEHTLSVGETK